jgi:hypothetical protein
MKYPTTAKKGQGINSRHMAIVALLFGMFEILLGLKMYSEAQFGMYMMAGLSFFVAGSFYIFDQREKQNSYMAWQEENK